VGHESTLGSLPTAGEILKTEPMNHPHGRHKAVFFAGYGFSRRRWRAPASALVKHAADQEVVKTEESRFGMRYVINGIFEAPDGRRARIRDTEMPL
jgi:hypothetical protein